MKNKPSVHELHEIISKHASEIEALFLNARITIVVRNGDNPDDGRDIVVSNDDLDRAIFTINGIKRGAQVIEAKSPKPSQLDIISEALLRR